MGKIIAKDDHIILRNLCETDIDNNIRWNTIDTEWRLWDAPWSGNVRMIKVAEKLGK